MSCSMRPLLCAAFICLATGAAAGPIIDQATRVEALIAAQDPGAAEAAERLAELAWDAAGFGFGTVALVEVEAAGFGVFDARETNRYAPGTPIRIYLEPRGFGYGAVSKGIHEIALNADLEVLATDGTRLAFIRDVLPLTLRSRKKNREFHANISYSLNDAPAGVYVLRTTTSIRAGRAVLMSPSR